jgi:hypothetical protein
MVGIQWEFAGKILLSVLKMGRCMSKLEMSIVPGALRLIPVVVSDYEKK